MIKATAWKRALQHFSYRQIHALIAMREIESEWTTYNEISAFTGIAVSTLHGSAIVVLEEKGAIDKRKGEIHSSEVKLRLTELGHKFIESLYEEVSV